MLLHHVFFVIENYWITAFPSFFNERPNQIWSAKIGFIMKIYTIRIVFIFWSCLVGVYRMGYFSFFSISNIIAQRSSRSTAFSKKPSRPKNILTNFKSISQEKFIVFNLYISQILPIWIGILFSLTSVTSNWEGKIYFKLKYLKSLDTIEESKRSEKSWKIQTNTKLNIIDGKWFDSTRFSYSSGNEIGSRIWEIHATVSRRR